MGNGSTSSATGVAVGVSVAVVVVLLLGAAAFFYMRRRRTAHVTVGEPDGRRSVVLERSHPAARAVTPFGMGSETPRFRALRVFHLSCSGADVPRRDRP